MPYCLIVYRITLTSSTDILGARFVLFPAHFVFDLVRCVQEKYLLSLLYYVRTHTPNTLLRYYATESRNPPRFD